MIPLAEVICLEATGVLVNSQHIASATRDELGHDSLSVRGLGRPIRVSRAFAHLFRPM